MRVLIVDDEISLAENMAEILAAAGHDPAIAGSAEEALAKIDAGEVPEVLLTDYRLPGASGAELITAMQRRFLIPALVMTAYDEEADDCAVCRGRAHDVLSKPVNLGRLFRDLSELGGDGR